MGEVYRATDENLGRDVAIKVLPAEVAGDAERLARFKREAHLLGSLNHTNVASIYGLEEADGKPFLVLELVEGEDLSGRLKRGAIPVDEAVEIAKQIAQALEEAHEQGIVHRDLKPANIKLRDDDKVKVLDFGLAKAYLGDTAEASSSDLTQSPTMSAQATQAGVILGTAAYMSPEQARGKRVDKRADIWAFGVVLFEMLAGKRLFEGETVSDTLASVLKVEPDWTLLPYETPRLLRELLRRCLTKNPRQRLHDIGDARIELEELDSGGIESDESGAAPPSSTRERIAWGITAFAVVVAIGMSMRSMRPTNSPQDTMHLRISLEPSLGLYGGFDLSRDGSRLVFEGRIEDGSRLFVRDLSGTEAVGLSGTDDLTRPFFSHDGDWIGAIRGNRWLVKVPSSGGPVTPVAEANFRNTTATWGPDDRVLFTQLTSSEPTTVFEVGAEGGEPKPHRTVGRETQFAFWPHRVVGTPYFLLTLMDDLFRFDSANLGLQNTATGERQILVEGAREGRLLSNGQLVFARTGGIVSVPFDVGRLSVTGPARRLVENAMGVQPGLFSIADNGTIAYVSGQPSALAGHLNWVDSQGNRTQIEAPLKVYGDPRISADGARVLLRGERDLWMLELDRGALTRLSFEAGEDESGIWSPDGEWIAWAAHRIGSGRHVLRMRADVSGEPEVMWTDQRHYHLAQWSPDGRWILVSIDDAESSWDILLIDTSTWTSTALLHSKFAELTPRLSPGGQFIAYASDETGRFEVYLQRFPELGRKIQVSTSGGVQPIWEPDGSRIFFRSGTHMMAAEIRTGERVTVGVATELFEDVPGGAGDHTRYDVAPDGRFLIPEPRPSTTIKDLGLVINAFAALDKGIER